MLRSRVPHCRRSGANVSFCAITRLRKNSGMWHRPGRAALQGRVSGMESVRALAPVVAWRAATDFFRSLLERTSGQVFLMP
jgi:hypothetical protein